VIEIEIGIEIEISLRLRSTFQSRFNLSSRYYIRFSILYSDLPLRHFIFL